jgi:hypothetical protein
MRVFSLIRAVSGAPFAIFAPILVVGAPSALAAKERELVVLEPSSPWALDYADDSCRLGRVFGEGSDAHAIFFEQFGPSSGFALTVAGQHMRNFRSERRTPLKFGDSLPEQITEPQTGKLGSFGPAVIYSEIGLLAADPDEDETKPQPLIAPTAELGTLPQLNLDQAKQVEFVELSQRDRTVRLNTGDLAEPFKALNICAGHLLETWGLDLARQKTRVKSPEWLNLEHVLRRIVHALPDFAVARNKQANYKMRVLVDEEGKVSDCYLFGQTKAPSLTALGCKYIKLAKFKPALDGDGNPMPSYYMSTLLYSLD